MVGVKIASRITGLSLGVAGTSSLLVVAASVAAGVDTTGNDFFQHGTQPSMAGFAEMKQSTDCVLCHANFDVVSEPYAPWTGTMLAQSSRDPIFWAGLTIANQDADGVGEFCMRCHVPIGFVRGNATPADGSALEPGDLDGVSCAICHRMVDPVYVDGVSPIQDVPVLGALTKQGLLPPEGSNARYVLDFADNRRGPYDDIPVNPHIGDPVPEVIMSPFHKSSELCWTCHDVSNPVMTRQPDGSFALGALDEAHPTGLQEDMFPLHRTFQEWKNSYYETQGGVQHDGRYGGEFHPTGIMQSCQDCHMPTVQGKGCGLPSPPYFIRDDIKQHSFAGSNTWVIGAVRNLFNDSETGLSADKVAESIARNVDMLERASDLSLSQEATVVRARITNQTGHKLPTGFPDGRRIFLNVKFYDGATLLAERGEYDFVEADLVEGGADTKVYEAIFGVDADVSAATGLPVGPTFHFVLANTVEKDNRIPPRGFVNSIAEETNSQPVGATYINGQHWDDTDFTIPFGATQAVVTVYYQTTSREFIEFLRDENVTDTRGQVAYDQWVAGGKSAPVVIDMATIDLGNPADIDGDGDADFDDLILILTYWGDCLPEPFECPFDLNFDGVTGFDDLLILLTYWGQ